MTLYTMQTKNVVRILLRFSLLPRLS